MDFTALNKRLMAEGYGPHIYESGTAHLSIGDRRIQRDGKLWTIFTTERGEATREWISTFDEAEACAYFYGYVSKIMLLLKTFIDRGSADALERNLITAGLKVWRNDIPQFNGPDEPSYRIFVAGSDLQQAGGILKD